MSVTPTFRLTWCENGEGSEGSTNVRLTFIYLSVSVFTVEPHQSLTVGSELNLDQIKYTVQTVQFGFLHDVNVVLSDRLSRKREKKMELDFCLPHKGSVQEFDPACCG